jgi:hypothetical protein
MWLSEGAGGFIEAALWPVDKTECNNNAGIVVIALT